MPWCDNCDAYQAPNALKADGTCPTCDGPVDMADVKGSTKQATKVPWHFKLMILVLVIYLGYRLIQGIVWLSHHF